MIVFLTFLITLISAGGLTPAALPARRLDEFYGM